MGTTSEKPAPLPKIRPGDPAWEFRKAEGFRREPRFAFMFDLLSESPDAYSGILEYEKASPDREDYWRCVLRERAVEIRACAEYGVPYFFCVERTDGNRLLNALGPAERVFSKFEFYDASFRKADVSGYEFFVRTHAKSGPALAAAIRKAGGRASVVETSGKLSDWPEKILPEFLGRKVGTYRLGDLRGDRSEATAEKVLSEHASPDGSLRLRQKRRKMDFRTFEGGTSRLIRNFLMGRRNPSVMNFGDNLGTDARFRS